MKKIVILLLVLLGGITNLSSQSNPVADNKKFVSLSEALLSPKEVISLDLSNQKIALDNVDWSVFTNLEYLSLKNDNLNTIPEGIAKLTNLKTLDLSGNNFKVLPKTLKSLSKLQVLYLNDEKQFDLENSMDVLSNLNGLRELHLENDKLQSLPKQFENMTSLEYLFLNDNRFMELPKQIMRLDHLRLLDFKNNKVEANLQEMKNLNFGFKLILE
jgi:Leucine-rich repeat (LRR) protein